VNYFFGNYTVFAMPYVRVESMILQLDLAFVYKILSCNLIYINIDLTFTYGIVKIVYFPQKIINDLMMA